MLSTRDYSVGEQYADRMVHGLGILAASFGVAILLWMAAGWHDATRLVGVTLYGIGLLTMLIASALANYDWADRSRRMILRERFDHAAIFVMIAGTYTPFTLTVLAGPWGWGLLAFVWAVTLGGVALKLVGRLGYTPTIVLYLVLGWSVVPAVGPLLSRLSPTPLTLLFTGGVVYSLGVIVFVLSRIPYHVVIWHMMVLIAAGCHYAAVLTGVVLPYAPLAIV